MDHGENNHCVETKWSMRYYYKLDDGSHRACGVLDGPTMVELRAKPRGYPRFDFEVPRQQHELERVDAMMEQAYVRGRQDNRAELAALLKDLIGL